MAKCPRCGREFIPPEPRQVICPECMESLRQRYQNRAPGPSFVEKYGHFFRSVTGLLIAANILLFLVTVAVSRSIINVNIDVLLRWGANYGPDTLGGQAWRLLASMFLHAGLVHIALNMWALLNLGILAEILFGRISYFLMYMACGLAGSIVSVWWSPGAVSIGASGAIFGVAGALLPALAFQKNARLRAALKGNLFIIGLFVFYTVIYGAHDAHIDNAAHLGGLLCGVVLGVLLPSSPGHDVETHFTRRVTTFVVVAVVLVVSFVYVRRTNAGVIEMIQAEDLRHSGDLKGAIQHSTRAVQIDPGSPTAHFQLGELYMASGNQSSAETEFQKTTSLQPDFAPAYTDLCSVQLQQKRYPEAQANCQKALQLDPKNSDNYFYLGVLNDMLKNYPEAIKYLKTAAERRPNRLRENFYYGLALLEAKDYDAAITQLGATLKKFPDDAQTRKMLALAYESKGDKAQAEAILRGDK